ncbi:MAG: PLP-dependent cysteine synthase family protein [Rhodospirillaceae bacterium]|nr:PLP-dependent cysteine synthase family protein [Rhodospirillaceae bacterium]
MVDMPRNIAAVTSLTGHTPLLQIWYRIDGKPRSLFAKLESMNMTGSIKDRMAAYIIRQAYGTGALKTGDTIVEATSGNTGISFSAIGSALGHKVRIFMPSWMSRERKDLITSFGAEIVDVTPEQGGFLGSIKLANEYAAANENVFLPRQFDNTANCDAHYETTGPEIERQLAAVGRLCDVFVAGVGTGGTVMGVGRFLRRDGRKVRIHPLEPSNSPTLSTGHKVGKHRIQGISDEFIPAICDLKKLDSVIDVWDGDAILMAQKLSTRLGLGVGISSGANILGAMRLVEELGNGCTVATVFPDSNKKYLTTDLCRQETCRADYWSSRITLESFNAIR